MGHTYPIQVKGDLHEVAFLWSQLTMDNMGALVQCTELRHFNSTRVVIMMTVLMLAVRVLYVTQHH